MGYYHTFTPKYAYLTGEMNTQKKKELELTEDMNMKFEILKGLFEKKLIRAYPLFGEDEAPFEVTPHFSCEALGGVLEQEQEGQRQFIGATGRKTTPGERNYPPTKGELCAVVNILRKYEHILCYKKFIVHCDHQPLKWLSKMRNPKEIYWRWLQEHKTYNFEIRWR